MEFENKFSKVAKSMKSNIIRELLKDAANPEIISFGGGVPDPETFPRNELAEIARKVLKDEYRFTLQYATTEGDNELKKQYIKLLENYEHINWLNYDNMLITVGSQQALHLISMVLLDEESYCAVGKPVYLGAANAFKQSFPKFLEIPIEDDGMNLEFFEDRLKELKNKNELSKLKFVYVVPNFQNPAGVTMSLEKRNRLAELSEEYNFLIVEDDPYGYLRFEGERVPNIYSINPERTLLLNTFSKILSPGLRIGMIIGPKELIRRFTIAKQSADLCCPSLTQRIAARYLENHDIIKELEPSLKLYKSKKDTMLEALNNEFKNMEETTWTKPEGGLFIWLTFAEAIDTMAMFETARKKGVLYVPGESFYVNDIEKNHMRLSFCLPSHNEIKEGIKRLRSVVEDYKRVK